MKPVKALLRQKLLSSFDLVFKLSPFRVTMGLHPSTSLLLALCIKPTYSYKKFYAKSSASYTTSTIHAQRSHKNRTQQVKERKRTKKMKESSCLDNLGTSTGQTADFFSNFRVFLFSPERLVPLSIHNVLVVAIEFDNFLSAFA